MVTVFSFRLEDEKGDEGKKKNFLASLPPPSPRLQRFPP
jgi:hypothetical protein